MSSRVIAGKAKGIRLKLVAGNTTRPIMDRVKEALFSILGTAVIDARVLDLFAGTGAVGIEALSRGAAWATFIDREAAAIRVIHDNLRATRLSEDAEVLRMDAFLFLEKKGIDPYSLVYIAPPQYEGLWKRALEKLDHHIGLLEPDAIVVVQIGPKEQEAVSLKHLRPYDERTYGNTRLWFFEYDLENAQPVSKEVMHE